MLGEEITNADEARAITGQYHDALARIDEEQLDANVSVKLTGLGLELDLELCREHLEAVVIDAAARGNFVRIDMEDSSTTDRALELFRSLRADGHENVGVVLQSYLRRTKRDVPGLDNVRLCKGIYIEPEEIAFQDDDEVRANYVSCLEALVAQGAYVGIATHDEHLIGEALRIVRGCRPSDTSSRCSSACGPIAPTSWSRPVTACASMSPTARTGTSTRCGDCRRIRSWRATSRPTSPAACCAACGSAARQ